MSSSAEEPVNQEGPSEAPPQIPQGWIAQWDGMSRKYYYVQISTGVSQWDVPTEVAPNVPSPQITPAQERDPYHQPPVDGTRSPDAANADYGQDRGLVSNMATNMLLGSHSKPQNQSSPLGQLAGSLLSGHSSSSGGRPNSGMGQLVGGLLGGNKPSSQQGQYNSQQQQHSGLGGSLGNLVGGFLGGKPSDHQGNYGHSPINSSTGYNNQGPPSQSSYGSQQQSFTPQSGQYHPPGQQGYHQSQPQTPQYGQGPPGPYGQQNQYSQSHSTTPQYGHNPYGQQNQNYPPPPPMQGQFGKPGQYPPTQHGYHQEFPNQQQQGHASYPPPPMASHPNSQGQSTPSHYPPPPSGGSPYSGPPAGGQGYGQPPSHQGQGGYGQPQGQYYPPPPTGGGYPGPPASGQSYGQGGSNQYYPPPPSQSQGW